MLPLGHDYVAAQRLGSRENWVVKFLEPLTKSGPKQAPRRARRTRKRGGRIVDLCNRRVTKPVGMRRKQGDESLFVRGSYSGGQLGSRSSAPAASDRKPLLNKIQRAGFFQSGQRACPQKYKRGQAQLPFNAVR